MTTRLLHGRTLVVEPVGDLFRAAIDGKCIAFFASQKRAFGAAREAAWIQSELDRARRARAREAQALVRERQRQRRQRREEQKHEAA